MDFHAFLAGVDPIDIPAMCMSDLQKVHAIACEMETDFGSPLTVTSSFRTWAKHKEIYQRLNDLRVIQGKLELPIPIASKHLSGQAVDLFDPDSKLKEWVTNNEDFYQDHEIYFESFSTTPNWLHFQIVPPRSGKRFFLP